MIGETRLIYNKLNKSIGQDIRTTAYVHCIADGQAADARIPFFDGRPQIVSQRVGTFIRARVIRVIVSVNLVHPRALL